MVWLMEQIDYLYYRLTFFYARQEQLSLARFTAVLLISLICVFACLDISVILAIVTEKSFEWSFSKETAVIVMLGSLSFTYFRYHSIEKFEQLQKRWEFEDYATSQIKRRIWWSVCIVMFMIPLLYGLLKHNLGAI